VTQHRKGRFLRKLTDEEEKAYAGQLPKPASNDGVILTTVWVVADERAALDKIKQALRVREPKQASSSRKDPPPDSTAAATSTCREDEEDEDALDVGLSMRSSTSVPAHSQQAAPNSTLHGATGSQQIHPHATANGFLAASEAALPQMSPIPLPNLADSHILLRQQQQVQELELRHRQEQIHLLQLSQQLAQRHSMLSPLIPQPFALHDSTLWPSLNPAAAALASMWPPPLTPLPTLADINASTSPLLALNRIQQQQNLQAAYMSLNQQAQLPPLNVANQLLLNQSLHGSNPLWSHALNVQLPLSTLLPNPMLGNLDTAAAAQWLGTAAVPGLSSSGFAQASAAVPPSSTAYQAGVAAAVLPPLQGAGTPSERSSSEQLHLQTLSIPPAASSAAARAVNLRPSTASDESSASSSSKASNDDAKR
jgi:hypothetical protein